MIPRDRTPWRLADLARELGLTACGDDAGVVVDDVASLADAGPRALAAVYDARLFPLAEESAAGILVVPAALVSRLPGRALLVSPAPKADFARAVDLVRPERRPRPHVDRTAVVAPDARLGHDVSIGPGASIGARARLGDRVVVGAGAIVLDDVEISDDAVIHPRVVLYPGTVVGARTRILAGAIIGAPGFGHARDPSGRSLRVPHLGRVVLEEDVEIGANATVDRATFGETRIRARARIDNLVQVGHNAEIGEDALVSAQSGLSGSSRLGRGTMMGGQSGLADHVTVGDHAAVAAKTAVFADVPERTVVAGIPAMPMGRWRRLAAIQARLPDLWRSIIGRLEGKEGDRE